MAILALKSAGGGGARTSPDDPQLSTARSRRHQPAPPEREPDTDLAAWSHPDDDDGAASGSGPDAEGSEPGLSDRADADLEKRTFSQARRKRLAALGHALPDGSYPIETEDDLSNAAAHVRLGHGDTAAASALIARRARQLGVASPLDAEKYSPSQARVPSGSSGGGQFSAGSGDGGGSTTAPAKAPAKKPAPKKPAPAKRGATKPVPKRPAKPAATSQATQHAAEQAQLRAEAQHDRQQASQLLAQAASVHREIAALQQHLSSLYRIQSTHARSKPAASGGKRPAAASARKPAAAAGGGATAARKPGTARASAASSGSTASQITAAQGQVHQLQARERQLTSQAAQLTQQATALTAQAASIKAATIHPAATAPVAADLSMVAKMMTTWTQQGTNGGPPPGHAAPSPGAAYSTSLSQLLAQGRPVIPRPGSLHSCYQPPVMPLPLASLTSVHGDGPIASSIGMHCGSATVQQLDAAGAASPFLRPQLSQPPSGNPGATPGQPQYRPQPTPAQPLTPPSAYPAASTKALAPGGGLNRLTTHIPPNER